MTHLDLFSGIGGFALAARWMGWQTVQFVEIDKFCQKVLTKNFPNVPIHGDIKTFDGTSLRGTVDILTGGFPCQPFSAAGKRKGTEDSRHLWPQMLRVIGEVQPSVIVGENVYGLLNWSGGLVFEQVQTDLENLGYSVTPFVLPACGIQAPHRRDRVWFVAHSGMYRHSDQSRENGSKKGQNKGNGHKWEWVRVQPERIGNEGYVTNTTSKRLERPARESIQGCVFRPTWDNWPTQHPVRGRNDGIPNRVDRIKSLGNAIVPQVAFEIFKAIAGVSIN